VTQGMDGWMDWRVMIQIDLTSGPGDPLTYFLLCLGAVPFPAVT